MSIYFIFTGFTMRIQDDVGLSANINSQIEDRYLCYILEKQMNVGTLTTVG